MEFSTRPFLILTPLLCFGVVAFDVLEIDKIWSSTGVVTLVISVILLYRFKVYQSLQAAFLMIAFIFVGGVVIDNCRGNVTVHSSDRGDETYLLRVLEISEGDWKKSVCLVEDGTRERGDEKVLLILKANNVMIGDLIVAKTRFTRIENKGNPGEFNSKSYWNNQNIYSLGFASESDIRFVERKDLNSFKSAFSYLRNKLSSILDIFLDGDNLSVAQALVLGDKTRLSSEDRASFSNAGAMHVLAVSGLHVGIVLFMLQYLFGQFPRYVSRKNATLLAILLIWMYAGITGFSPSVLRASFMFSLLALGQISSRRVDGLNTLFFTAFVLILLDPLVIYNIGFQLSYLAMIGILLLYKRISSIIYIRNKWLRKIWEGTAVGIAAQIMTVPLTLYYFHQFPNYFALSNLIVMALAGLILGTGLVILIVQKMMFFAKAVGLILSILLSALIVLIQLIGSLPGAVAYGFEFSENTLIVLYILLLTLVLINMSKKLKITVISALFIALGVIQFFRYRNLTQNELVIFNSNDFVAVVKYNQQLVCAYSNEDEKPAYFVDAYKKVRGGEVSYHELLEGSNQIAFDDFCIEFELNEEGVKIQTADTSCFVRRKYGAYSDNESIIIDMPYLTASKDHYSLGEGAYVLALNRSTQK